MNKPMTGSRRWLHAAIVLGFGGSAIAIGGCKQQSTILASAGAVPQSAYFIGPQPGPDHPLPQAVNPYADDASILPQGRQLFVEYNCSGCHGDHGGGGMGPSLRDTLWYYGGDDASIFASITEGRQHGMPSWGTKLPRDQIWQLVAYIKSLRTPNEPDPPH
jgi:cytochrome c oxidase cbb3-type subunit 3